MTDMLTVVKQLGQLSRDLDEAVTKMATREYKARKRAEMQLAGGQL